MEQAREPPEALLRIKRYDNHNTQLWRNFKHLKNFVKNENKIKKHP